MNDIFIGISNGFSKKQNGEYKNKRAHINIRVEFDFGQNFLITRNFFLVLEGKFMKRRYKYKKYLMELFNAPYKPSLI